MRRTLRNDKFLACFPRAKARCSPPHISTRCGSPGRNSRRNKCGDSSPAAQNDRSVQPGFFPGAQRRGTCGTHPVHSSETAFAEGDVGGAAVEVFDFEVVRVFGFDGVGEVVRAVGAPGDGAVAQGDVVGVLDGRSRTVSCGSMAAMRGGGAVVEEAALVSGRAVERDGDVVEDDVVDAATARTAARRGRCSRRGR